MTKTNVSIDLAWQFDDAAIGNPTGNPGSALEGFYVAYNLIGTVDWHEKEATADSRQYNIEGLLPYSEYNITVITKAMPGGTRSEWKNSYITIITEEGGMC